MDLTFEESNKYFQTRSRGSQISAWSSKQSEFIHGGYSTLVDEYQVYEEKFKDKNIPRPEFWHGKIVMPEKIEFWIERKNRLHERLLFTALNDKWNKEYLYP